MCKNTSDVDPILIIRQEHNVYLLTDGGGKHHLWEYIKDTFVEVYERDLAKILAIQHWNIGGMALSRMGIVDWGSAGYSFCSMEMSVSNGT